MNDLKRYCELFYEFTKIPSYIYQNKKLVVCYPLQKAYTHPPAIYLTQLRNTDKQVSYAITNTNFYYGCIKSDNSDSILILGPVCPLSYDNDLISNLQKQSSCPREDTDSFVQFYNHIPIMDEFSFINTLIFINYTINNVSLTTDHIFNHDKKSGTTTVIQDTEQNYNEIGDKYYSLEKKWMHYIRTGNIRHLNDFSYYRDNKKSLTIKDCNYVDKLKDQFIIAFALASHSAIEGGLDPGISYRLLDKYLNQIKNLSNINDILSLFDQAQYDFSSRVAELTTPLVSDNNINKAVNFIRTNTHRKITVVEIAAYIGYSPSYLSRKFNQILGFRISDFIIRCKLEEAKNLLSFSDRSIGNISSLLCFSSQSHFQRRFKEKFGVTPQAYRSLHS